MSTTTHQATWALTQIVTMEPFAPEAFGALLLRDGRKVATVENRGNGGCNHYVWLAAGRKTQRADREAFKDAAKQARPDIDFEVEDHFIADLFAQAFGISRP